MDRQNNDTDIKFVRFQLRKELKRSWRESAGVRYYVFEDPVLSKFYRVGEREWEFIKRFDGLKTLEDVVDEYEAENRDTPLDRNEIRRVCNWLNQVGVIHSDDPPNAPVKTPKKVSIWANPLFIRVPLLNPDRLLARALPLLSWTVSKPAFVIWCIVCVSGLTLVCDRQDEFSNSIGNVFAVNNWLYIAATWIALKIVHELFHGIVCKKYGGTVPRCGFVFILFSPIAFIDVTSSWRFRSKWQRIYTAAAGMYAEFFVAAIAAWGWAYSHPGVGSQLCQNIVVTASISTLMFNGNFLMKFDGYYILGDLIEVQNLYQRGQQYIRYLARRYWLDVPSTRPNLSGRMAVLVKGYAFASLAWRWLFMVGILILAGAMFHGLGIILAVMAGLTWFFVPLVNFAKYLMQGTPTEQPNRRRFAKLSLAAIVVLVVVAALPWPGSVVAPAVVQYAPLSIVRAESPGFVECVFVRSGQSVSVGDPLLMLRNSRLQLELAELDLEIKMSERREAMLHADRSASYEQMQETETLLKRRRQLDERVAALKLYAKTNGRVMGTQLDHLVGQYFAGGQILFAIGDESRKELQVSIAEDDVRFFTENARARVRIKGGRQVIPRVRISNLDPKATRQLPHRALASMAGGPLAVTTQVDNAKPEQLQLIDRRFIGTISLTSQISRQLFAGQLGKVRVSAADESVGQYLAISISNWIRGKVDAATNRGN